MFWRVRATKPEATRIERVVSGMSGGELRDYMRTYVNSAATAVDLLIREGQVVALDTIQDNCRCVLALAAELQSRRTNDFMEPPNEHMKELVGKFMAKKGILSTD